MNIVDYFIEQGFLINPKLLDKIKDIKDKEQIIKILKGKFKDQPLILNKDIYKLIDKLKQNRNINWDKFDKARVLFEKRRENENYNNILKTISVKQEDFKEKEIIVVKNYKDTIKKKDVQDFVSHFKIRYNTLKDILINRPELQNTTSINRVLHKQRRSNVSIIGLVRDKRITKNNNIIINLEDPSGSINILVNRNRHNLIEIAEDIVLDEVIGITGVNAENIVFVNNLFYPDVPADNKLKKLDREEHIVFTSDLHVGSKYFFEKEFLHFIEWLNGKSGTKQQRETAKKIKYLFLAGDLAVGVGVYPGQEEELKILDIYDQYKTLANYLSMIRRDVQIILIGGNHDALRLAEPQPMLDKKFCKPLYEMENVKILTNPSMVNIFSSQDFEGFNILMYHGGSFPYLADNVETVTKNGRLDRADLIMKSLLQKRHLSPTHGATQYIPDPDQDFLIIDKIPDFFVSGHIHKINTLNYRGVSLIAAGCWTSQTENQEKRGIVPDPCRVLLVNLKNRNIKILNFSQDE